MNPTKPKYKYGDTVKNIDGTVAGSAVFDPDTGNPLTGAGAFNPNTGDAIKNVITPDLLKGTQPIPLPAENLTNPTADKVLSIADTAVEGAKTEAGTSQENYVKALQDVMNTTDKLGTYEEQAGAKVAEKTSRDLGNQVTALVRNFSAFRQEVNNNPMITGQLRDRRISSEQTRVANTVADLQFTKSLVDQNLTDARKWAKDKIDLELRPLELEVENKKFVRDNAQKFFTDTQMKRLESQIKQEEDKIADMREQKKKNLEMYTQASVQEAPPELLTRAKEAIDEGKSTSEVVGILGKYAGDIYKTELLKEQIQTEKAQRSNIWNTIANRDAATALAKGDTGPLTGEQQSRVLDQVTLLKNTLTQAKALSGSAGPSGIKKFVGDTFKGDTDFRRLQQYTDTLATNILTLSTDPNIKKFFGPQMTEKDVEMMIAAGTTLNPGKNSPQDYLNEAIRLEGLVNKMENAVLSQTKEGQYIQGTVNNAVQGMSSATPSSSSYANGLLGNDL